MFTTSFDYENGIDSIINKYKEQMEQYEDEKIGITMTNHLMMLEEFNDIVRFAGISHQINSRYVRKDNNEYSFAIIDAVHEYKGGEWQMYEDDLEDAEWEAQNGYDSEDDYYFYRGQ